MQGERTGAGAQQEGGKADDGTETVGESQGGRARTVNEARVGTRHADGVAMEHAIKRGEMATSGCVGRREYGQKAPSATSDKAGSRGRYGVGEQRAKN